MPANVDAIAVVADGARDAANLVAGLEHDGMHIRTAEKLQGGREPRGPGADE